jgi:addiction module HigA family antidote
MSTHMKNPPHPGELIKGNIEELGLSITEAAECMGISRQQLYRIVKGQHGITPEMAYRLELAFQGAADFWLKMQMNYDLAQIRLHSEQIKVRRLEPKAA